MTLLVAQAGSGKSVLLSQWADSHPDLPCVWVDLVTEDNDPAYLVRDLLSAFATVHPALSAVVRTDSFAARGLDAALLRELVAELRGKRDLIVVLDDLDHLTAPSLTADLAALIDLLPPNVHVLAASRVDPPASWSRTRLRNEVREFRQEELALSTDDASVLLAQITGGELDPESVRLLVERTEGWMAGIHLAGLSLRLRRDPAAFVADFRGSDRLVADYLTEEVLNAATEPARRSMLELSVLDRMSAELIRSLFEDDARNEFLSRMERESAFVVPLDDRREWFRFHRLFSDLLRYRMRLEDPDGEVRILSAAASWHLDRDDPATAIAYLIRARDWTRVVDIIRSQSSATFEHGDVADVVRWITALPAHVLSHETDLRLLLGILTGLGGRAAEAEDILRSVAAQQGVTPGQAACAETFLAALVQWRPHPELSFRCAERALLALGRLGSDATPDLLRLTDPSSLETIALISGGRALFLNGEFTEARAWLERGLAAKGAEYSLWRISGLGSLALLDAWLGRIPTAHSLANEALELAHELGTSDHPATADAYLARALSSLERGEPSNAVPDVHAATVRIHANRRTQLMWVVSVLESRLAGSIVRPAESLGPPPPLVAAALAALQSRLLRLRGSAEAATRALSPLADSSDIVYERAAAALASGRHEAAKRAIELLQAQDDRDQPLSSIRRLIVTSRSARTDGRTAKSDSSLAAALSVAADVGLVEVFIDAGPDVTARIAAAGHGEQAFADRIRTRAAEATASRAADTLETRFTDRELELLALLPTHFTNAELAIRFFVSVNTIKSHMAHIYQKLDVSNRSGAIARATQLGLLK
ncbi:LuxR C-terminal-related transcriptional regulator [Leifsonia sp. NPDC058248]|uniref:LuxR C-terminal-related transcriptional regulator n=1 Tax=Leifsonia sp. NPDC058248 TaxID=3346402 RepID=UPI0036DA5217